MPLVIDLLLSTVGALLLTHGLGEITVGTCGWYRENLLPDTKSFATRTPS